MLIFLAAPTSSIDALKSAEVVSSVQRPTPTICVNKTKFEILSEAFWIVIRHYNLSHFKLHSVKSWKNWTSAKFFFEI